MDSAPGQKLSGLSPPYKQHLAIRTHGRYFIITTSINGTTEEIYNRLLLVINTLQDQKNDYLLWYIYHTGVQRPKIIEPDHGLAVKEIGQIDEAQPDSNYGRRICPCDKCSNEEKGQFWSDFPPLFSEPVPRVTSLTLDFDKEFFMVNSSDCFAIDTFPTTYNKWTRATTYNQVFFDISFTDSETKDIAEGSKTCADFHDGVNDIEIPKRPDGDGLSRLLKIVFHDILQSQTHSSSPTL